MAGPAFFSGRRFVATQALKQLRQPSIDDVQRGSYLALYWILAGRHEEAEQWAVSKVNELIDQDRMLDSRAPVLGGFYRHRFSASRDADGVPAALALEHPFPGLVLLMIDRSPDVPAAELDRWYQQEHLPSAMPKTPAALCIGFDPLPLPADAPAYIPGVPEPDELGRRCLQLWFLDRSPLCCWSELFAGHAALLRSQGLGELRFAAPFVPTIPGSDRYADELW
jgi:hypothetical protein